MWLCYAHTMRPNNLATATIIANILNFTRKKWISHYMKCLACTEKQTNMQLNLLHRITITKLAASRMIILLHGLFNVCLSVYTVLCIPVLNVCHQGQHWFNTNVISECFCPSAQGSTRLFSYFSHHQHIRLLKSSHMQLQKIHTREFKRIWQKKHKNWL